MLVTLLVLYYVRPVLRSRTRRRKALSILLVAASLVTSHGPLQPAHGNDRFGQSRPDGSPPAAMERTGFNDGEEIGLFSGQQKLREGTIIPPTIGRVVNLGRRWAFVPMKDATTVGRDSTARVLPAKDPHSASTRHLGGLDNRGAFNAEMRLSGESSSPHQRNWNGSTLVRNADDNPLDAVSDNRQHIVLTENQMLQRIVETMKADTTDDRWELSGEILEFFDENRLLIRTVQRANSN